MAAIVADRVLETSITTGIGPYTLAGAVTGFRSVASVATTMDTFAYFAEDVAPNGSLVGGWEVGVGTVNSDGSIARTVEASSNTNLPVVWAAGTRRFGIGLSAKQLAGIPPVSGTAQLDFGAGNKVAEVVVTGVPATLATSRVFATMRIQATAAHPVDDLEVDPIRVHAKSIVAGVGFIIRGEMDNATANGQFLVDWSLQN